MEWYRSGATPSRGAGTSVTSGASVNNGNVKSGAVYEGIDQVIVIPPNDNFP